MFCLYVPHNKYFDFKRTSDAKIQRAITGSEDSCFWLFSPWSRIGHALRPIFMLWLVKIFKVSSCGKLCIVLKLVYFDSWNWQSFVSTCHFFNCLFPLDVQNEKQMLSRVLVFVFHFAWCVRGFKSLKRFWSYWIAFRSCISNGKPEQLLYLMFVFCVRGTRTQPLICGLGVLCN